MGEEDEEGGDEGEEREEEKVKEEGETVLGLRRRERKNTKMRALIFVFETIV